MSLDVMEAVLSYVRYTQVVVNEERTDTLRRAKALVTTSEIAHD